jgi:hypothetical protein
MQRGDVGDERNVGRHENDLRKGTSDFIRFQTPRLDSFYRGDLRDAPLLPDQTMGSGVVPVVGAVMNFSELLPVIGRDAEKERDWKRSEKKGVARLFSWCSFRPQQAWGLRHDCGDDRDASVTAVHDSSMNHCNILASGRGVDENDGVAVKGVR